MSIYAIAKQIDHARCNGEQINEITERFAGAPVEDGYRIQSELRKLCTARGEHVVGYKTAYTSSVMQQKNGVNEPMYGFVAANRVLQSNALFSLPEHGVLKGEPEVIFVMGTRLMGPNVTEAQTLTAVAGWHAGFELVTPCVAAPAPLALQAAENMSFGAAVLGGGPFACPTNWNTLDVRLFLNGILVGTGPASNVMDGSPLRSVMWLANRLAAEGYALEAGDIVLSGAPITPVLLAVGDSLAAEFGDAARVSVTITA